MKAIIENVDNLKNPDHEKKIISALRRVEKATKEIVELGYSIYVSAHGNFNVMNDDVLFKYNNDYHQEQIVASTKLDNTDCGDW